MTDRNLGLSNRRGHRGVLFNGAGMLCAVAVTLAGCSGPLKNDDPNDGIVQNERLEAEQAKLAKSERARKAAVKKLAAALAANKSKDKKLLAAKQAVSKYREELQAADKDVADLETRLAKATSQQVKTDEDDSAGQKPGQLVESLKAELDKTGKERDALKAELADAKKDVEQTVEKMLAAASQENKEAKQKIGRLDARIKSVETEKNNLKQSCEQVQQRAAQLDKELKESRAEQESLFKRLQATLAEVEAAVKGRAQVEQAAAKEAKELRDQLATAERQISSAKVKAASANDVTAASNECSKR
ncbi:MAG: hypothetical protein AAF299_18145 [Pseudomonadota bacterium]